MLGVYGALFGSTAFLLLGLTRSLRQGEYRIRMANAELGRLSELRKVFLQIAVHNLRAPVGAVSMLLENMRNGFAGEVTKKQLDWLDRSLKRLGDLSEFMSNLQTLSSLETDIIKAECTHVDILEVVEKLVEEYMDVGDADISGTTISFKVCYDPSTETFSAVVDDIHATRKVGVTAPNGSKGGLAGSTNTIFDNFEFWILEDATHSNCPDCETNCYIGADTFTRSNSTNIGCLWEEVSGDWDINSNQLRIGAGAGIAKYKKFHPTLDYNQYVEVDVVLPVQVPSPVANHHRVLVAYSDSSNYHYAEFRLDSAGVTGTLTIGKGDRHAP